MRYVRDSLGNQQNNARFFCCPLIRSKQRFVETSLEPKHCGSDVDAPWATYRISTKSSFTASRHKIQYPQVTANFKDSEHIEMENIRLSWIFEYVNLHTQKNPPTRHSSNGEIAPIKLTKIVGQSTPTNLDLKRKLSTVKKPPNGWNLQPSGQIRKWQDESNLLKISGRKRKTRS